MQRILYNCKTAANGFTFAKFDEDMNLAGTYTITVTPPKMSCDCPGWPRKSACKHTRMVNIFALAGAIDTSQFYCYETQTWHQPIQAYGDGEDDPTARKAADLCVDEGCPQYPTEHVCISPVLVSPSSQFRRRV